MTQGQRVRVIFTNATTMYHPMHIHGHTFQVGPDGPRKDTVIVLPGQKVPATSMPATRASGWRTATTTTAPRRAA
jgi:FtsP/CotA-like multicopper oxidase with cupredoxin domain